MAGRIGFEPTVVISHNGFPNRPLKPDSDTFPICKWRKQWDSNPRMRKTHLAVFETDLLSLLSMLPNHIINKWSE